MNLHVDVSPIESARARFLQIIVDHFIRDPTALFLVPALPVIIFVVVYKSELGYLFYYFLIIKSELFLAFTVYIFPTGPCTYKRRELATSLETRTRFPELAIQGEKRVCFVVVNGLDIAEKPDGMPRDEAE